MIYTCRGSVRGECGIRHRTREAAERHCAADHAAIRRRYPSTYPTLAYSDRTPAPLDDEAQAAELAAEEDEAQAYEDEMARAHRAELDA